MKTRLLIFLIVGISIIATLVVVYPPFAKIVGVDTRSTAEIYWDDYTKKNPDAMVVNSVKESSSIWNQYPWSTTNQGIEFVGLDDQYQREDPIVFDVMIYGDGSGCGAGTLMILQEHDLQPAIFSQNYVSICKNLKQNYLAIPFRVEINTPTGNIPSLESGKYVTHASYYQNRGSYGEIKQYFVISP